MSAIAPQAPARPRAPRTQPLSTPARHTAPPLQLVPPAARSRRGLFVVSLFLLLASGLTGLLLLHTWAAQDGFTVADLQHRQAQLRAEATSLQSQEQRLESPAHLTAAARSLGMRPITDPRFVTLHSGRVVARGTAASAPPSVGAGGTAPAAGTASSTASKASRRTAASAKRNHRGRSSAHARGHNPAGAHQRTTRRTAATRHAARGASGPARSAHRHGRAARTG